LLLDPTVNAVAHTWGSTTCYAAVRLGSSC
jgi:hypothetical protein